MSRATINDVADLAGVSIKTVSRVVNDEPNVRQSTRDRVEQAITSLNYRPNLSARSLASDRSHLIGLIYDDPSIYEAPSAGYIFALQEGALKACRAANCELLIHPCNYRNKNVSFELKALIEQTRTDGIVLAAPLSNMPRIVNAIVETNTPLVRLSPGRETRGAYSVATDDRQVSHKMVNYLASLGHRRIAFISGHRSHVAVGNRLKGYRDGLEENELPFDEQLLVPGDNSLASGEAAAQILLALEEPPTAIFAANDDMAAGVLRVAHKLGIGVPRSLSVAGFDDSALALQIYPSLTTIRQPLATMGERAALSLIGKHLADPGLDVIESTMKIRESTGPVPK